MSKPRSFDIQVMNVSGMYRGMTYSDSSRNMVKIIRVYRDNFVKRLIRWLGDKTSIRIIKTKVNIIKVKPV